ncbi:hypothetical protein [Streptomyces sp. NPDC004284]|uniref:hypothetical protein n=1 Tax=Streptomyces sp. NPDC004284 TaxID=3364695 RepID=UPI0036A17BE6
MKGGEALVLELNRIVHTSGIASPVTSGRGLNARLRSLDSQRTITVRYIWTDLVNAWANRDQNLVDEIWDDVISDLGSAYAAYAYVTSVGIGA